MQRAPYYGEAQSVCEAGVFATQDEFVVAFRGGEDGVTRSYRNPLDSLARKTPSVEVSSQRWAVRFQVMKSILETRLNTVEHLG